MHVEGASLTGGLALFAAACAYSAALAVVRRVDRTYPVPDPTETTWWFGYSRDLVNLLGMVLFALGLWVLGLPRPLALLGGFFLALAAYSLDYLYARRLALGQPALTLAASFVPLVAATVALREPVADGLDWLLRSLF